MKKKIKTAFQLACIGYSIVLIIAVAVGIILSFITEMTILGAIWFAIEVTPKMFLLLAFLTGVAVVVYSLVALGLSVGEKKNEKDN